METTLDRHSLRTDRPRGGWKGGLILILLGIIFLARQTGWFVIHNWWAVFILMPAIGNFGTALVLYRHAGRFTQAVRASIFGGLMVLTLASIFLFDLRLEVYWPLFVLVAGLSLLFAGLPLVDGSPRTAGLFAGSWLAFTGLGAAVLGLGFLGQNLGWFNPAEVLPRWWALCILLPALGGVIAAAGLAVREGAPWAALSNLAAAAIVATVAIVALLGFNWNVLWPVAMIAGGGVLLLGALGSRQA